MVTKANYKRNHGLLCMACVTFILPAQKYYLVFSFQLFSGQLRLSNIFLGSEITADSDCSHKIRRNLFPGRKIMTNLDSILKGREITFLTKVCIVKAMAFSIIMYRCENWTTMKAEHQRMDAFKLWCQRRLLRVPWTLRRSNQSIPREINPEYSLEGLMPLDKKNQLIGKDPNAGKD